MENSGSFRFLIFLLTLIAIVVVLSAGQQLLLPLATAGMLAMVLNPLLNWLLARGVPRGLGIALCTVVFLSFFALVLLMLTIQINYIVADWPQIERQALVRVDNLQDYIQRTFSVAPEQQMQALRQGLNNIGTSAAGTLGKLTIGVGKFVLIVIYLILFLAERARIEKLILRVNKPEKRPEVEQVIERSVELAGKYMFGQLKIVAILAVLYSIGFSLGGVPYAIFLGCLAALFSLIPFLGNIIGGGIAAALSLAVSGPGAAGIVIIVIVVVQLLSDYILQPLIVGNSIDLSPLATIFCIFAFSWLWGPMGAILALPITASMQTVFKQIPSLKPVASFLGTAKKRTPRIPLRRSKVKEEPAEEED